MGRDHREIVGVERNQSELFRRLHRTPTLNLHVSCSQNRSPLLRDTRVSR
jgi:hypothetical protein